VRGVQGAAITYQIEAYLAFHRSAPCWARRMFYVVAYVGEVETWLLTR
jgi:hypothetical protein